LADRGAQEPHLIQGSATSAEGAGARRFRALLAVPGHAVAFARAYFQGSDPTFWVAFTPALIVAALLFVRSPVSNYIFDEQEALLANPYVNGEGLLYWEAFKRDFWGLPPERSIGSYRPIPNLVWRALWQISEAPWLHHWINVVVHAANAAVVCGVALRWTRQRGLSWLAGACFLTSAVLTEAVSGVVGIADVLGGLGVLLGLAALALRSWLMPLGVFASITFGLFSKESAIVALPLLAWAALVGAPVLHARPLRLLRVFLALSASLAALVFYTYVRRHFFPVDLPVEVSAAPGDQALPERLLFEFLRWFQQPRLPHDPINNPLAEADFAHRVAGGLRIYLRGLGQVLFPWSLSGDYSYPQEPVPDRLFSPASIGGALAFVAPLLIASGFWLRGVWLERQLRRQAAEWAGGSSVDAAEKLAAFGADRERLARLLVLAVGLFWVPVAYFPHSNIPLVLPTVRAERFWYLPVIGAGLVLAVCFARLPVWLPTKWRKTAVWLGVVFFGFQAVRARSHAFDYSSDLHFWEATRRAAPDSAKAHLNYSVMVGARGRLDERLEISKRALELAPRWPMAHVYLADTLCRLKRPAQAWPHYERGFALAPNDPNLIALGLQCLWDEKAVLPRRDELLALAEAHRGSWLAYLASDIVHHGAKHGGVEKKYRPRGYDEGPKPGP
jgi:tetratricopeptide (TPR) repeat protein